MEGMAGISQTDFTESAAAARSKEMGKDDFLTMFVAQLKYQDPLNPMQGQEFAAQLAQFSSLEQLFNVNDTLQTLQSTQDDVSRLQALDFIGKEIVAKGDALELGQGEVAKGSFELGETADCSVAVLNEDGYLIRSLSLGVLEAGAHSFQWDGHDGAGNLQSPGTYRFKVVARNSNGALVSGDPRVTGKVTGVNLEDGGVRLYVGQVPVSITNVTEITDPPAVETSETF